MELLLIMLVGAILSGLLASSRGRNPAAWAVIGALFPLISLLVLIVIPNFKEDSTSQARVAAAQIEAAEHMKARAEAEHKLRLSEIAAAEQRIEPTRPCPFCAEPIKPAAIVCRFCGRDVPSASTIIAS